MTTRVEVRGAASIARGLRETGRGITDLEPEHRAGADALAAATRGRAPRRTGRLASSVEGKAQRNTLTVEVRVPYAGVQEFGWPARRIAAQPYARPALAAERDGIVNTVRAGVARLLGRIRGA